ncbi:hypothetical protein RhiirA4_425607 [Rhizophagus irregularis]|uniref:Uncharacterized protein n=1 Tax=Rhizophagus irregularis TaxID=588596 RepID=A0A2I1H1W1_9GLOM|nr:hypothetical protein RhiirA4_425607 [Rhizophagus irregularis]
MVQKLKQFLFARITLEFEKFKTASMKSAVAERNKNFYENKGKFISSSLNRERRCIVLDRVLVIDLPDSPKLLVAPEEIKAAAITHFQNVVGPSVSPYDSLSALPPRQFLFTWTDLKRLNLMSKTGKIPSWFTHLINIPNLISYLPASSGYSCVRIPEVFLVDSVIPPLLSTAVEVSPQLPVAPPALTPEIHISSHLHIYIFAKKYKVNAPLFDGISCGWIQRDEDAFILASGSFLWTHGPLSPQASELGFILQVLRLLPSKCSITFYSSLSYSSLYTEFCGSSSERRVRFSHYLLWMAIHNQILASCLDCTFQIIKEVSTDAYLPRFIPLRSSYSSIDWNLTFDLFKETLYHRVDVAQISSSHRFRLLLWFDELPLMFRLRFRYPGLYADDSLCPNCGIFMETLEHFFTCSLDEPFDDESPLPISFRNRLLELLDQFLNRLAQKASNCPKAQLDLDTLLIQLKALPSLGFSSLQNYSDTLTFTGLWFLRGFIPCDLSLLIASSFRLPRRAASKLILRQFLKLHREIYHQLWRPRCKMKSLKDTALNITPTMLRTMKCSDFTNFQFDTSPVTPFLTNKSLSPLQAFEWFSLGIFWIHSAIIRGTNWLNNLSDFLKSRTVLVRFKVLAYWIVG